MEGETTATFDAGFVFAPLSSWRVGGVDDDYGVSAALSVVMVMGSR